MALVSWQPWSALGQCNFFSLCRILRDLTRITPRPVLVRSE